MVGGGEEEKWRTGEDFNRIGRGKEEAKEERRVKGG